MIKFTYRIKATSESRSFPTGDDFLTQAVSQSDTVVIIGSDVSHALAAVSAEKPSLVLVELDLQCLGELTGECRGEEGSNVLGFSRYRLGSGAPSQLIELVVQPRTSESAKRAAIQLFEGAGFKVSVCADRPGRIVDRLIRPYFNAALEQLDNGLATADDLDLALRKGLGFKRGPIELLDDTGLADHCDVSEALSQTLSDPFYRPARRARVAANRKSSR